MLIVSIRNITTSSNIVDIPKNSSSRHWTKRTLTTRVPHVNLTSTKSIQHVWVTPTCIPNVPERNVRPLEPPGQPMATNSTNQLRHAWEHSRTTRNTLPDLLRISPTEGHQITIAIPCMGWHISTRFPHVRKLIKQPVHSMYVQISSIINQQPKAGDILNT